MINDDVISMPDTWEYPWYASWDLAFHTVALAMVDIEDAKASALADVARAVPPSERAAARLRVELRRRQPAGARVGDARRLRDRARAARQGDVAWLKSAFQKLLVNFTWWINRKDPTGRNLFEGGFLGLDNIGVFDRSAPLPTGGHLEQSDGTAWMAFFSQCMLGMALELAEHDPLYEDMVLKFAEHFLFIAAAMDRIGDNQDELWDEEDGFFYDVLRLPDGSASRLKVRSMVGLLPLCASTILPADGGDLGENVLARLRRRIESMPELLATIHDVRDAGSQRTPHVGRGRRDQAAPDPRIECSTRTSSRALTACERCRATTSITRSRCRSTARPTRCDYLPAESDSGMFGGNSNWRGPVWFPVNYLVLRALLHLYTYYGDDFKVECPTGSGNECTLFEVATELGRRVDVDLRSRRARTSADVRRRRRRSRPIRTGRTCCSTSSTSTATTVPGSAPATRPDGPVSWLA